jgi:hypothetical protein
MSANNEKGVAHFLPKGLKYGKVERHPRWLHICQAHSDGPAFEVEIAYLSAKAYQNIFKPVAMARQRGEREGEVALQKATRAFLDKLVLGWRGFTVYNHNDIVRAENSLMCSDEDDPEAVAAWNEYVVNHKEMPFDREFLLSVYQNSPADRFQNVLVKGMEDYQDAAEEIGEQGNEDSRTSSTA